MDYRFHEENKYDDSTFPFEIYRVNRFSMSPKGRGFNDLHWHQEIQFTYAEKGPLELQINGETYSLAAQEVIFIPAEALHATKTMTLDGSYYSLNFHPKMLSFFLGSTMEQKAVLPFLTQQAPIIFKESTAWQKQILSRIHRVNQIYLQPKDLFWEYQIAVELVIIWNELLPYFSKNQTSIGLKQSVRQKRMQEMLKYIDKNFQEELTLEKIADVAHVSISECTRTFKDFTNYSPYEYLLQYRIREAANLILADDDKIEIIAIQTGFKDVSSFIQAFKKRVGKTPLQYRKKYQLKVN